MAVDYFLKIDGAQGESKDKDHKDEIEIESYSFVSNQIGTSAYGTGSGGGKVTLMDFSFQMRTNKASPPLFLYRSNGKHLNEATLTARKAGGKQEEFLVITLHDIIVSNFQTGLLAGTDIPTDQITLNFAKIEVEYLAQDAQGHTKSVAKRSWDIKTNTGG